MKERPILFSAPMVRALLDGSKTQTRRIVKPHPRDDAFCLLDHGDGWWPYRSEDGESANVDNMEYPFACPYGQPGDHLWVREAFCMATPLMGTGLWPVYRATCHELDEKHAKWKPSIHMPRAASRILLEIVSVHVERLNEISEDDARAEGITDGGCINCGEPEPCSCTMPMPDARDAYIHLWESINGAGSWNANPWVWVIEFKRVTA